METRSVATEGTKLAALNRVPVDNGFAIYQGKIAEDLLVELGDFERLWALHPAQRPELMMHGRIVLAPRWQQAFARDYHFAGTTAACLPTPEVLQPALDWVRENIDGRLNGLLVNWYDGSQGHYIGAHRDSRDGLVTGCPIVTISLGQKRVFRLRPWKGRGFMDIPIVHGAVLVLPWETNLACTHEGLHTTRTTGRRISLTFRAFA